MPPGSQFRLRLRRRKEKLRGTIFSFKKHTKDGRCFWAEYFFEVFWRLLLKPKSRKNISSKVDKISNYRPVEGLNSKLRPGLHQSFEYDEPFKVNIFRIWSDYFISLCCSTRRASRAQAWVSPENFLGGGHPFQGGANPLREHHLWGKNQYI